VTGPEHLRIGLALPTAPELSTPEALTELVAAAERLGYDSLWANDHVLLPASAPEMAHQLDCLALLAWLCARTERVAIGTSVLVLPYREAPEVAKALATIDWLSGGRLVVGVGVGWFKEEFAALGVPFAARGARTDEGMRVIRNLWGTSPASFDGRWWSYREVVSRPPGASARRGTIPLLVGGASSAAVRRAVEQGDGWHPLNVPIERLPIAVASYRDACAAAGRTPGAVVARHFPGGPATWSGERVPFTGSDDEMRADLARYAASGIGELVLSWEDPDVATTTARWERFAELREA
jgi:probable F420-dependent oxidoreductase